MLIMKFLFLKIKNEIFSDACVSLIYNLKIFYNRIFSFFLIIKEKLREKHVKNFIRLNYRYKK